MSRQSATRTECLRLTGTEAGKARQNSLRIVREARALPACGQGFGAQRVHVQRSAGDSPFLAFPLRDRFFAKEPHPCMAIVVQYTMNAFVDRIGRAFRQLNEIHAVIAQQASNAFHGVVHRGIVHQRTKLLTIHMVCRRADEKYRFHRSSPRLRFRSGSNLSEGENFASGHVATLQKRRQCPRHFRLAAAFNHAPRIIDVCAQCCG